MYGIALSVAACRRAGTRVDVAWVVEAHGFSARDPGDALAVTPGGGRVGSLLSGSLDEQVADAARHGHTAGRLLDLRVGEVEALAVGLLCGGDARCLLVPATDLPAELWEMLTAREAVCLVSRLDGDAVVETALFTSETIATAGEQAAEVFGRGVSDAVVTDEAVVTVFWPVAKLDVVGAGAVADALSDVAGLLGWQTQTITDVSTATGVIAGLAVLDKVVVTGHDVEVAGPVLAAALASDVGYIGALGSRRTQRDRADWLAYRGITDLDRIHGPAGLAIGANTPAEIAVSIVAEALAVRTGSAPVDLHWMRTIDA